MKKTLFIAVLSLVFSMVSAQNKVDFEIADGISDAALKTRMEQQVSKLLTAVNTAEAEAAKRKFQRHRH